MNEISQIIMETAEKIMEDLCTKEVVDDAILNGRFPQKLWDTLVETGLTTIGISEELGGTGGSISDAFNLLKIAGKYSAPIPLAETLLANWILSKTNLPLMEGPASIALVANENKPSIFENNDGWIIDGVANSVPFARYAKYIVAIGKSDQSNMIVVLDSSTCQIQYEQNLAGEARDRLVFKEIRIPENSVANISDSLDDNFVASCALIRTVQLTGALEKALELTVQYSQERIQFGRSLSKFQAIQQQIAILAGHVSTAKTATELAIQSYEDGEANQQISVAKVITGEAASQGAAIAHQIHGAIGFTDEHALHLSTRRLWSWRDEFGNESYWANELGEVVTNTNPENLWPFITSMSGKVGSY